MTKTNSEEVEDHTAKDAVSRLYAVPIIRNSLAVFERFQRFLAKTIKLIVLTLACAVFIRTIWALLVQLHWVFAVVSFFYGIGFSLFLSVITRYMSPDEDIFAVVCQYLLGLVASVTAFASLSYIIAVHELASYDLHGGLAFGTFVDFYGWHLLDLVPALDIWETLRISAPVEAIDTTSGVLLLLFRILVLLGLASSLKKWLSSRRKNKDMFPYLSENEPTGNADVPQGSQNSSRERG